MTQAQTEWCCARRKLLQFVINNYSRINIRCRMSTTHERTPNVGCILSKWTETFWRPSVPRSHHTKLLIFITFSQANNNIRANTLSLMHIADKLSIRRFFGGEWQRYMIASGIHILCVWKWASQQQHEHSNIQTHTHSRQFTFKCISINFIVSRSHRKSLVFYNRSME